MASATTPSAPSGSGQEGRRMLSFPASTPAGKAGAQVLMYPSAQAVAADLASFVEDAAAAAIKDKGSFTFVVSGGSVTTLMGPLAASTSMEWDKVYVFWVDERNVPHDHEDSNYKGVHDALLSNVPIPPSQIYAIKEHAPVDEAAADYEQRLMAIPVSVLPRNEAGFPIFDLIMTGVGPDGHVASLFPNRPQTTAASGWILPVSDSPKPPPQRITFTLPIINAARHVVLVALGDAKAEAVQEVLEEEVPRGALPSQLVRPSSGTLQWVLDAGSAQRLHAAQQQ